MAIIKCKMCGGDLELVPDSTVCECEYCGTRQTVPAADDEKKLKLFERANRLRRACEFDKAAGVYESIVADFDTEAEAYWGLVLCKFGIEYVDDPATGKKVPTCHRAGFESVEDDQNFEQACENADAVARRVYREEGRAIDELRERILEVSGREEPYDVFISYKELAEDGERTEDSVLAQDIYDALTAKGYRVFFSRVTLEDKLGVEYEPYIFAALQSAKVMLLVGMDYENLNAVWVKNEWSRYLALMAQHKEKVLIPCYKNMDPYDLPKEVRKLAAQDMGKVGAMQDLLRGVEKIIPLKAAESAAATQVVMSGGPNVAALQKRGMMALEDGQWDKAKDFFDQALNMDAENAEAYLGLALADLQLKNESGLSGLAGGQSAVANNANYQKFLRFASPERKQEVNVHLDAAEAEKQRRETEQQVLDDADAAARAAFREKQSALRARIAPAQGMIGTGYCFTFGVKSNGTAVAAGTQMERFDISGWKGIVAIAVGSNHAVGLKSDGTVVAVGENVDWQCDVDGWRNIIAVAAGDRFTVGLCSDGTAAVAGIYKEKLRGISGWKDIISVAAGYNHTVGLKADGTVVAVGSNQKGECNVDGWSDIVAIAAGKCFTAGLKSDGTVVTAGDCTGKNNCSGWREVIAITTDGTTGIYGVKADGTVIAIMRRNAVSGWKDVVAISASMSHIIALKSDGTLLAVGETRFGSCDVADWKLFESVDTLEQERKAAKEKAEAEHRAAKEKEEAERRAATEKAKAEYNAARAKEKAERREKIASLEAEQAALSEELKNLKGLFTGKRRKEIETRLDEISAELKKLR